MRTRLSFVVLSVALLGFAPAPFAKKERRAEDQSDVAGTWEIVQWSLQGKRSPEYEGGLLVEMKKERLVIVPKDPRDRNAAMKFEMTLHPTAHPPAFTLRHAGERWGVGSYRLQKDQMTMICSGPAEKLEDRPTDFAGQVPFRLVLRRIKRD
jgi:uncharacterized protein (TIGR03067 family)